MNQDFSLNGAQNRAARGSYISAFGTGFGVALAPGPDGPSVLASGVSATVGGVAADVVYAGLAPGQTPGLQQINIHLPENVPTGPGISIQLLIAGSSTQPGTTVAIQ